MSTTNRIVLLNRTGEELFSGESLLSEPPPPPTTLPRPVPVEEEEEKNGAALDDIDDEEPIPETLRSSVLVRAYEPVSRPIIVDLADPPKDADESHRAA